MTILRSIRFGITTALLLGTGFTLQAGPELLVRAKGRDGKESNLFKKIIITSSLTSIYEQPKSDAPNRVTEPFSVYFHLKGDDGSLEKNGFIRVGDGKGKPFGWIPKKDQKDKNSYLNWNTRFVLEPVDDPKRKFVLLGTDGKPLVETDKEAAVPEGKRKFALVTDVPEKESGEDTQYPVAVYVGKVATKSGSLEAERNEIADLKLEIVFVVEALGGLKNNNAHESVRQLLAETADLISQDPELRSAVRYGLVEFKDGINNLVPSRVVSNLTENKANLMGSFSTINFDDGGGDWPEDVLAGLNTAIEKINWSNNSSKHIIVVSSSPFQIDGKGMGLNDLGKQGVVGNPLNRPRSSDKMAGFNSTGKSIDQILNYARPQSGSTVDNVRNAKYFHCILAGKKIDEEEEKVLESIKNELPKIYEYDMNRFNKFFEIFSEKIGNEDKAFKMLLGINFLNKEKIGRKALESQLIKIAKNNGSFDGVNEIMEPDPKDIERVKTKIKTLLSGSFVDIKKVRAGQMKAGEVGASNNQLTRSYYKIVNAALGEKFKDLDAIPGFASIRDDSGREVAIKKVLVAKEELERLKSTFDELYTTFKGKTAKVDRQDVGKILEDLKQAIVTASTGQQVNEKTKLKDMIGDLPLRTAAMDTTAADIALMPSDTFTDWLDKLRQARTRVQDLLDSNKDWLALSDQATYDKYTFLRLNELP